MRFLVVLLLAAQPAAAQFGQNHVVRDDFRWRVRSTEHFDIHYYDGSAPLVGRAAEFLERAFDQVAEGLDIRTEPPSWASPARRRRLEWRRRPFFLYASPNDFQQSNIVEPGDGTGGITEPFKDRFFVYNDGSRQWLEEVITHEFVHVMQFHVLLSGPWRTGAILKSILYPLWMIEGMSGYFTHGIESTLEEVTIRDAATSGGLIPLPRLEHFGHLKPHQVTLAYKQGAAAVEFIAQQYGRGKLGRLLKLFESRFDTGSVLRDLLGLDVFEFDKKYREYVELKYARAARRLGLREPDAYGSALTGDAGKIPRYDSAPVFSADGKAMLYLSTRAGHPPVLRELDLLTGRSRTLRGLGGTQTRVENVPLGNFANLSRVLALSPDGRLAAFAGTRNHRDALYLLDRRAGRLERREPPGFQAVSQPAFSPDGKRVAFSGMKDSVTDLYVYDLEDGGVSRLTADPADDQMPAYAPDGRSLAYSSEVGEGRRLLRLFLDDGRIERLEDLGGEARDPVFSPDGRTLLFVLEKDGRSEVAELDLASGRATRLTRSLGGSFTPAYAPGGEVAFAALRRGRVRIYKGTRSDFEDDELAAAPARPAPIIKSSSPAAALSAERPYRFSASTDLFIPAVFYSSVGGFFFTGYWQGSDMLGDHQAGAFAAMAGGYGYDYAARYGYGRRRPRLQAAAFGAARRERVDGGTGLLFDDSTHGQAVGVSYPFDRYRRVETSLTSVSERLRYETGFTDAREARLASAALVHDSARGRYLVATQGSRARASYTQAAEALGGNRRFQSLALEGHQFFPTGGQSALALRVAGLQSLGRDHPELILGGLGGVRGYARSTTRDSGSRLGLLNAEWRFPVAPDLDYHMWYLFPDFYFKAVFGSLFTDAGYAWESTGQASRASWRELRNSIGLGVKIYTFILQQFPLVIAMDYAHRTTQDGGIFYFYLGQLF